MCKKIEYFVTVKIMMVIKKFQKTTDFRIRISALCGTLVAQSCKLCQDIIDALKLLNTGITYMCLQVIVWVPFVYIDFKNQKTQ